MPWTDPKKKAEYYERYRQRARAAGMCSRCNLKPATPTFKLCMDCRKRRSYRVVMADESQVFAEPVTKVKCSGCRTRPPTEGKRTCQECRDKAAVQRGTRCDSDKGIHIIDRTPGCVRCGLRGEHSCLPESATFFSAMKKHVD